MNVTQVRRLLFFSAVTLALLSIIAAFNLWRFSAQSWVQQALPEELTTTLEGHWTVRKLGTELSIENPQFSVGGAAVSADFIGLRFNFLSIIIGMPNLSWLGLEAPVIEWSADALSLQQLHWPIRLGFRELSLTDGLILLDDLEITNLELSMLKNGMFGEYAVQSSAELADKDWNMTLGLSTLLGADGDNTLILGKTQLDANVVMLNWTGRIAGKIRSIRLSPDNETQLSYLSWSSSWKTSKAVLPYVLDWAGGLTDGHYQQGTWQLGTLDTAIAYLDSDDTAHTLAIQSNDSRWTKGDLQGQLGLSLLAEYPLDSPWQSYNLVMSGQMHKDQGLNRWHKSHIRLAVIDQDGGRQMHMISAAESRLDLPAGNWQLYDGQWNLEQNDQPVRDIGFGQISGQWPQMRIDQNNAMSDALQPALNLISTDVEKLDALFSHLAP